MNHPNESILIAMLERQGQYSRQHIQSMAYNNDGVKKSFSFDSLNVLLTLEEGKVDDVTINSTSISCPFLECENAPKYRSNRLNDDRNADEDVISHAAIVVSPSRNCDDKDASIHENDQSNGEDEDQAASDIPTVITHASSTYNETDDDCSNDSISTIGIDPGLNDNPRSIFSKYWDLKNPNVVPEVIMSTSSIHCKNGTSTSVQSTPINENVSEDRSHTVRFPEMTYQEYALSRRSRSHSVGSDTIDYETTLRRYERGRTTIPRAATLNDQKGTTITDISNNGNKFCHSDSNNSPAIRKSQNLPEPTQRRRLFSNDFSNYVSNLPSYSYSDDCVHKTSSTSALLLDKTLRMHRSCLRPLSRSKSAVVASDIGGRGVTFDPNVSVVEYDRPVTKYASNGWSKWFV